MFYHNDEQGAQVALVCWRRRRKRHLHWRRRWTAILRQKGQTGQVVLFFGSFIFFLPLLWVKKVNFFAFLRTTILRQKSSSFSCAEQFTAKQALKKNDNVVQVTGGDTVIEDDLTADLFDIRGVSNTNTNSNPTYS